MARGGKFTENTARNQRRAWIVNLLLAGAACGTPDYVGSRDCKVLAEQVVDKPWFASTCESCQGATCPMDACSWAPCVDQKYVVQGCDDDSDCGGLNGARCGMHSAPNHVCTTGPDNH